MAQALLEILLLATAFGGAVAREPTPPPVVPELPPVVPRFELTEPSWALANIQGQPVSNDVPQLRLPGHSLGLSEHAWAQTEPWRHLVKYEVPRALGGFSNVVFETSSHFSTGPEVAWMTPETPTENWQDTAVVMPGWGIWYTAPGDHLAVGFSACTRFVVVQQSATIIDPLTSQARLSLLLP